MVRPIDGGVSPNRFYLDLCPVRSVHDTDRSLKHFRRLKVVLSASTPELAEQWVRALQTWRRRNWKEPVALGGDDEPFALRMVMIMYRLEPKLLRQAELLAAPLGKLDSGLENGADPAAEQQAANPALTPRDKQIQPLPADSSALLGAGVQVTRFSNRFNFRGGVTAQIVM